MYNLPVPPSTESVRSVVVGGGGGSALSPSLSFKLLHAYPATPTTCYTSVPGCEGLDPVQPGAILLEGRHSPAPHPAPAGVYVAEGSSGACSSARSHSTTGASSVSSFPGCLASSTGETGSQMSSAS
ncbi:hypothetical protein N658DRAFT_490853 [Parathielavia hyrcaniae]|uniref:Uncharacterized protein n=1 Tax=Parathielavia hyrcaniae TaxID=113614 RepID=A0AAN6QFG2_9PEZI|nr:hypothetical protein N658DRAFT_490853 [Parathielavia hyrcaniae]